MDENLLLGCPRPKLRIRFMRFLCSIAFLAISGSSLLAQSWAIGKPLVLDEQSVAAKNSVWSELQVAAGEHSYAAAWQWRDADSSPETGEWRMIALSPEGQPLSADRPRFQARDLRLVRRETGFAVLTVEGSALNIRAVDSAGNHVAGPAAVYEFVNGYAALAAASNGSEIVVVWTEGSTRYDQPGRITGVMIHPDGRVDHGVVRELPELPTQLGHPISTHLAIESNGSDFLILWSDCEKIGTRFYTLSCSVTSRLVAASGPELFPASEILPAGYFRYRRPGLIASDGDRWIVLTEDAKVVAVGSDGIVEKGCAAPAAFLEHASQLAWDGRGFVLAETERDYGRYLSISRVSEACEPLASSIALETAGRFSGRPAIASIGDGRSLVVSRETEAVGTVYRVTIVLRTVTENDARRRAVRR